MEVTAFNFKFLKLSFVVLVFVCEILSSEVPRPRGVSLSRAALYIPDKDFTCFDGSKSIPFNHVNDDYCDCADGSDEPGTSACPNGVFYCPNAGHKPITLPSSRVNDGICDCCDGTDEYASGTKCINNCIELGKTAREEAQRFAELVKAGAQLKVQLSQKGQKLKQEKRDKLAELEKNREEADKVKAEKQAILKEVQDLESAALEKYRIIEEEEKAKRAEIEAAKNREEALAQFKRFDSNADGLIVITELQVSAIFDKDKNGEVSEEEAKSYLNNEDSVDEAKFIEVVWPILKPLLMAEAGLFKPPSSEQKEATETDDLEGEEGEEQLEEESDIEDEEDHHEEEEHHEEQPEEPHFTITYDEETKKLIADADIARKNSADADKQLLDIDNEITSIKEYLNKDLGPQEEFAPLDGECFEYRDHEYIYKLCPFKHTLQIPLTSSSDTRLGSWGKWAGPEDNPYASMLYERGQSCWNGPQRSTKVNVVCGSENKLLSVSEPNRCEYLFEFSTPAACTELFSETNDTHDEL